MTIEEKENRPARRLIGHHHKRRPLRTWIVPLVLILAVIYFLPRLVDLLEK